MKTRTRLAPPRMLLLLAAFGLATLAASAAGPTVLENQALRVEIDAASGRITVNEKSSGQSWQQAPPAKSAASPVYRLISSSPAAAVLERAFDAGQGAKLTLQLSFTLPSPAAADLRVEARAADPKQAFGKAVPFIEPFILDAPHGVLAVADYSDGHLYPLDAKPFPRWNFSGDRLDLPWVAMCDLDSGRGYLLLLETVDDAEVAMQRVPLPGGRETMAPRAAWRPQQGVFGYPRALLYHFTAKGGYVALCKRYRQYAQAQGLIVPFTEKIKANPNLARLFGAPDVWGDASPAFARQAKAAGVQKMLIHGRPKTPADMRAVNELGYLTSEYDNYTDIMQVENGKFDSNHDVLPDSAVMQKSGDRMKAWLTWDKKQFMKRCPTLWEAAARRTAEKVLAEWPYIGRFIDVTTAEGAYECYDPKHPMTRSQKRDAGTALHRVFRDRGLVMGGEHGIWWCVPVVDYIEGMQSAQYASWPAGYLRHPKTKDEEFTNPNGQKVGKWADYAKWGIGHEWRAPLWELVFHDCIVSTWYWGDSSDFLLDAAPEVTPKKDAFNVLYGTIPLMWANKEGSWRKDRAVFLRTYRNTCKLHEALATAELLTHEFVTPDHAVQRTRFSDGTECLVNFGEQPYRATLGGKTCELPQNGWVVSGPKVRQSLALENGKPVTEIHAPGYAFSDRAGACVALIAEGSGKLRVIVDGPAPRVTVRPAAADPAFKTAGAVLRKLDAQGQPGEAVTLRTAVAGGLSFGPVTAGGAYLLTEK